MKRNMYMKTQLRKMKATLATATLAALATGSVAHAAAPGFDVTDLNIMFGTGADGKLAPEIPVDNNLLAPSLFIDVQREATTLGIGPPAATDDEKKAVMAPDLA